MVSDKFAFGLKYDISQELLEKIVIDEQFIHTAYDYGFQKTLKETALKLNKKLNLIYKVYLNYFDYSSEVRLPLINQVERVYKEFDSTLHELVLQISCIPSYWNYPWW